MTRQDILNAKFHSNDHFDSVCRDSGFTIQSVVYDKLIEFVHGDKYIPLCGNYQLVAKGCGFFRVFDRHDEKGVDFQTTIDYVAEFLIEHCVAYDLWY